MLLPILIIVAVLVLAGGNGERPIRPGSAADYAKDACMAAFTGIGDWDKAAKSVGQGDWTLEGIPSPEAVEEGCKAAKAGWTEYARDKIQEQERQIIFLNKRFNVLRRPKEYWVAYAWCKRWYDHRYSAYDDAITAFGQAAGDTYETDVAALGCKDGYWNRAPMAPKPKDFPHPPQPEWAEGQ